MKKTTKCLIAILTLLFTMLSTNSIVFAKSVSVPSATSDFYVNDFAEVFSEEQKSRLMENAIKLSDKYDGAQVVITTVKSLDSNAIEDYSYEMYNQYGIGKNDMGILILLSTGDRQIRIEVGKAMEAYINDSKAGRFIDKYAIPSLKENKFDEGLIKLQEALISEVQVNLDKEKNNTSDIEETPKKEIDSGKVLRFVLIVLICGAVCILILIIIKRINSQKRKEQSLIESVKVKEKEIHYLNSIIEKANNDINTSNNECFDLKKEIKDLKGELEKFSTWKEKAIIVCPDLQERIEQFERKEKLERDKSAAKIVDDKIEESLKLSPSKESKSIQILSDAIREYNSLSIEAERFVKGDINKVKEIYKESLRLEEKYEKEQKEKRWKQEAKSAQKSILSIISSISIVRASDYRNLKDALSIYNRLSSQAKFYFDESVYNELQELYKKAQREKQREEEERRRQIDNDSFFGGFGSSSSGGSSFGGFGGSSGGGGASRGF